VNPYFVILSHNEPEIFRLLDQLKGQNIVVVDDFSEPEHAYKIVNHSSIPKVIQSHLEMDFSRQRNRGSAFVPEGEWVVTIDSDEYFASLDYFLEELSQVTTEGARIRRCNVITDDTGRVEVTNEFHIRAWRNHPGKNGWQNRLHETPFGIESETSLVKSAIMHVKTRARCVSQHLFYEEVKKAIELVKTGKTE